jgi:hypothetical protein
MGPRTGLHNVEKRKFLPYRDSNSDPSVAQPVAIRYTDYTSVSQPPGRCPVPDPDINYTGPSSYRKKNLSCRSLTKVENHWTILSYALF